MMHKYLDLDALNFDASGRVHLSTSELKAIERSFVPSAGGNQVNEACRGSNDACTNTTICNGSTNQICTNDTQCRLTRNNGGECAVIK